MKYSDDASIPKIENSKDLLYSISKKYTKSDAPKSRGSVDQPSTCGKLVDIT